MSGLTELLARVEACEGPDNSLDIAVDIALFKPDTRHTAVRANAAGTKLIYTTSDGRQATYWAGDHTLNAERRAKATALLRALIARTPATGGKP